jgi:hypothetical protein
MTKTHIVTLDNKKGAIDTFQPLCSVGASAKTLRSLLGSKKEMLPGAKLVPNSVYLALLTTVT